MQHHAVVKRRILLPLVRHKGRVRPPAGAVNGLAGGLAKPLNHIEPARIDHPVGQFPKAPGFDAAPQRQSRNTVTDHPLEIPFKTPAKQMHIMLASCKRSGKSRGVPFGTTRQAEFGVDKSNFHDWILRQIFLNGQMTAQNGTDVFPYVVLLYEKK